MFSAKKRKGLYALLAGIVHMDHGHRPSMRLCWATDELCRVHLYTSVMSRDRSLVFLKYLHFGDNQNPPTQNIPITTDCGKAETASVV
jgi:hypothetical protein